MARHSFGWFGWFSAAGFVVLGLLYVLDVFVDDELWAFSETLTLLVALLAGIGAAALYFGNDPTDDTVVERETTP